MNKRKLSVSVAILVIASLLTGCFNKNATAPAVWYNPTTWGDEVAQIEAPVEEPVIEAPVATEEPVATKEPVASDENATPATAESIDLFSAECSPLNYEPASTKYQIPGGYAVPIADLVILAAADMPGMIFFEGDDFNVVEHHVAVVYGGKITSQGVFEDGGKTFKFKDGAFWACASSPSGVPQDETVGTSIWKKWKNLKDEGKSMKVCAYLTTSEEPKCFDAGVEPTLVDVAQADAEYRDCDSNETAAEQTPYGLKRNGDRYTAHAGASYCRTLVVGKLTAEGLVVAVYFSGARNEFSYIEGARFFLIPTAWGVTEMQNFVNTTFPDLKVKVELLP